MLNQYLFLFLLCGIKQEPKYWPLMPPLPSYGKGREHPGPRYGSLIHGQNLKDVVITGTVLVLSSPAEILSASVNIYNLERVFRLFTFWLKYNANFLYRLKIMPFSHKHHLMPFNTASLEKAFLFSVRPSWGRFRPNWSCLPSAFLPYLQEKLLFLKLIWLLKHHNLV